VYTKAPEGRVITAAVKVVVPAGILFWELTRATKERRTRRKARIIGGEERENRKEKEIGTTEGNKCQ
jgi:hypothetical protein